MFTFSDKLKLPYILNSNVPTKWSSSHSKEEKIFHSMAVDLSSFLYISTMDTFILVHLVLMVLMIVLARFIRFFRITSFLYRQKWLQKLEMSNTYKYDTDTGDFVNGMKFEYVKEDKYTCLLRISQLDWYVFEIESWRMS